jgi:membrane protein
MSKDRESRTRPPARKPSARRTGSTELHVERRTGDGRESRSQDGDRGRGGEREAGLLKSVWRESMEDDVLNVAAGMAYFAFLALPPTILVIFAFTGFFGGEQTAQWLTQQLTGVMPDEASEWIDTFVDNVVRTNAPGPFSIGLVLALWAASNVFMAVTRALNMAYDVEDGRSFIRQRALALGVTLLFAVFVLGGAALLLLGPQIASAIDLFGAADVAFSMAQWVLPFLLVVGAFAIAYYLLPAREKQRHPRSILIGAVVGAVIWVLATIGFRLYINNFADYNETYGVLGGVIVLMLWLYLTMLVILIGGQFAAELERRNA